MSHRTAFRHAFNGGDLIREPTLAERIALALMQVERRTPTPHPITLRKFSWEKDQ